MSKKNRLSCAILSMTVLPWVFCVSASAQSYSIPGNKLSLNAAVVLSKDFCATKTKKGTWAVNQETFDVGKVACEEIESALQAVYATVDRVEAPPTSGDAQVVLTPRFADITATQAKIAFSDRELVIQIEWTAKDKAGKTIWVETVQGSAKRHIGNSFTYKKNLRLIVDESVKSVAQESATKMAASPELAKLAGSVLGADAGGH